MVKQLQEYAKKNDLKIIGAGDYKTFYDEGFIDLTPYEWVDLFRNAEKVITGTFHGTVFSIKYNKSVLCYPTEKNRINKIRSLLSDMKIASRLLEVGCEDDFIPLLDTPMDYTETRNYIAQKIQEADGIYFDWRLLPASLESATDSSGWPLGDAAQGVPETAKTSLLSEPAAEWKAGRCFGRRGRTGSRAI